MVNKEFLVLHHWMRRGRLTYQKIQNHRIFPKSVSCLNNAVGQLGKARLHKVDEQPNDQKEVVLAHVGHEDKRLVITT